MILEKYYYMYHTQTIRLYLLGWKLTEEAKSWKPYGKIKFLRFDNSQWYMRSKVIKLHINGKIIYPRI